MLSVAQQLKAYNGKILWLASYPKSGNTWFRSFLSAIVDEKVDINYLKADSIFSARRPFDLCTDLDSRLLYDYEIKKLLPDVYRYIATQQERLYIVKVHDAYSYNQDGLPLIPTEVTHKVIYIIRNPLEIACSFANHADLSLDNSIQFMNNRNQIFAKGKKGSQPMAQFRQLLYDWSGHVESWTNQQNIEVILLRYEDMVNSPVQTFQKALHAIGLNVEKQKVATALKLCSFKKLQAMEAEYGFKEKNPNSKIFFRKGKTNSWESELKEHQIEQIVTHHTTVMKKFGYL